ncbi:MAG: hypothetical protein WCG99_04875 [Candidatus Berkelbacteria bacterium]
MINYDKLHDLYDRIQAEEQARLSETEQLISEEIEPLFLLLSSLIHEAPVELRMKMYRKGQAIIFRGASLFVTEFHQFEFKDQGCGATAAICGSATLALIDACQKLLDAGMTTGEVEESWFEWVEYVAKLSG